MSETKNSDLYEGIMAVMVFVGAFPLMMLQGLVVWKCWEWFGVPAYPLGYWHTVGLLTLLSAIKFRSSKSEPAVKPSRLLEIQFGWAAVFLVMLGWAALAHALME